MHYLVYIRYLRSKKVKGYRVWFYIRDKKIMFIYINFSFDFLGLDNVYF